MSPEPAPSPALARPANAKVPEALEEEVALLREEQVEPRQVDLLLVNFDLREVGVDREIGGDVLRDAVFDVAANAAGGVVIDGRRHRAIGRHTGQRKWLELEVRIAPDGTCSPSSVPADDILSRPRNVVRAPRHLRQVRPLVLPAHHPPQVHAPHLIGARLVAQRLERDGDLDRPAAIEIAGADVPHRVPVGVGRAFVGHLAVGHAADRVGVEDVAVALVVERVEHHAERVVLPQLVGVAAHFIGDAPLRMRLPVARRNVDVVVVEEDPRLGLLGGGLEFVRLLLHEVGNRGRGPVDSLHRACRRSGSAAPTRWARTVGAGFGPGFAVPASVGEPVVRRARAREQQDDQRG